jgi:integrative and conjugative element protein (TIGR02256 family)
MSLFDIALDQLRSHKAVGNLGVVARSDQGLTVEADVSVSLPSRAVRLGQSSTGVRAVERCTFPFTAEWPLRAPRIKLRRDFPVDLPHINPHRAGEPVSPCLFDGSIDELQSRFGLARVVDQLVDWLEKAAAGQLIDDRHGWEPTRRDDVSAQLVFDADDILSRLPTDGSILALPTTYFGSERFVLGQVSVGDAVRPEAFRLSAELFNKEDGRWSRGRTLTFIARAQNVDGKAPVFSKYRPDTVVDIASLAERANSLGINGVALEAAVVGFLKSTDSTMLFEGVTDNEIFALVILAARRPIELVGAKGRDVEFIPYVVRYFGNLAEHTIDVKAAYHAYALSPSLLRRTSGFNSAVSRGTIVLAGCGSLGSKIAMHLGRAGFGNFRFVDTDWLAPHNVARHALLSNDFATRIPRKAELMKDAFATLSHRDCEAFVQDFGAMLRDEAALRGIGGMDAAVIIDATASLAVLTAETLPGPLDTSPARVIRTLMYGQGRCALVLLEGTNRSSRVDDLTAAFFNECRHSPALRAAVVGESVDATRLFVGDNCSSLTTPMPDSLVSRAASMASIRIEQWFQGGLPEQGQLCFSVADTGGIGAAWHERPAGPTVVLRPRAEDGWTVRVLDTVVADIDKDVEKWHPLETGGALIGHVDHATRTMIIAAVIEAPADSIRERVKFILGVENLEKTLRTAHADSAGHLHFVGTWHSHPMGGRHSELDRETLARLCINSPGLPMVSLVWTPQGLIGEVGVW